MIYKHILLITLLNKTKRVFFCTQLNSFKYLLQIILFIITISLYTVKCRDLYKGNTVLPENVVGQSFIDRG